MFRISTRLGFAIVVLLLASTVPLYAQQTGLTLEDLSSRIELILVGQGYILKRVAALETAVAAPTEAAPAQIRIVANANVNIRRGPGTEYAIIGTAKKGDVFILIDSDAEINWWEVGFQEESGWIHAYYVDLVDFENASGLDTPNPSYSTAAGPTITPTPTDIPHGATHKEWAQMANLVAEDIKARGIEKNYLTPEALRDVINTYLQTAIEAAEDCEFTTTELMRVVDDYAEEVDEAGVSERLGISSRWDLLNSLVEFRIPAFTCEENIQLRVEWIIEEYSEDEG